MYSVVLMAALTAGGTTAPSWHCGGGHSWGCYSGWACYGGCYGCWGCYGGYYAGGWGYTAYGYYSSPAYGVVLATERVPTPRAEVAQVVVELPADAKLFVDNQLTSPTSQRRTFNTPTLNFGQAFYYVARAEVTINGKTHTETKQIIVRAGETSTIRFAELLTLTNLSAKPVAATESAKPLATAGR